MSSFLLQQLQRDITNCRITNLSLTVLILNTIYLDNIFNVRLTAFLRHFEVCSVKQPSRDVVEQLFDIGKYFYENAGQILALMFMVSFLALKYDAIFT